MRGWLAGLAAIGLAAIAGVAAGDSAPQVTSAVAGGGFGSGQIERYTLRFSEPMIPLGDPRRAAPIAVSCPVAGAGRWIDQQSWVYEFARPLPGGQRCSFTIADDAKSLRGATLGGQHAFAVDTGGPTARTILPASDSTIDEDQTFLVAANVAANRASIAANAYCAVDGVGEKIPVDLLAADVPARLMRALGPDNYDTQSFRETAGLPSALPADQHELARSMTATVALRCHRPLPPGKAMALVWPAAIAAPGGRTAGQGVRFDFKVREAFAASWACERSNPRAGCNPLQPATVSFTAPVARATALAARIMLPDGKQIAPKDDKGHDATLESVTFDKPLPVATTATLTLPDGIKDASGRPLTNARRFPLEVRFDEAPPLVKFAAPFGILEANEGGVLPVTVRGVEPALSGGQVTAAGGIKRIAGDDKAVAGWLQRLAKAEEDDFRDETRGKETVSVNHTRETPLLAKGDGATPFSLKPPLGGKAFEVVGVPLGKPGFYVVEVASPALGRSLLGRDTPRYVAAGALVTNMAVHFKWGRGASLAWVTTLDTARPVAGAEVRIADACTGAPLAAGRTDADGRLLATSPLPDPNTSTDCSASDAPLIVSARAGDDYSFTLTGWADGIRPFDFDLPFGWNKADDILHTVFDRSLVRQGETVNMKHILRAPVQQGFRAAAFEGTLKLEHSGSGTDFVMPLRIGANGIGETSWTVPKGAPMGDYQLIAQMGERTIFTGQTLRVDEYRLPTMRATVTGPKAAPVRPASVPLDLFVGYLSGGGASAMPVSVRAAFEADGDTPKGWDGWSFGGVPLKEGTTALDGDDQSQQPFLPPAQTIPLTLDRNGAGRTAIPIPAALDGPTTMTVEMDYQDANGETLTASQRVAIRPSAVRVALKTDGWLMKQDDLRLKLAVLDNDGHAIAGAPVEVALYSREILSARRRLIGGFYAFDNAARVTKLSTHCSTTTDGQGLAACALDPGVSGEVYAVATARDHDGRVSTAVQSVWLVGDDEWWFGGDNGDRMDLVPEHQEYKATDTARFQVRMPFRSATALVTVEREGVMSSFVTTLSGRDPVVEVPLNGAYAPDVYVSVLAVRGRVTGWRLWLAEFARKWHLPWFSRDGASPTALVDLAKPSFRLGVAKVTVGWDAHRLDVAVRADHQTYHVRDTAQVAVQVRGADGKPPRSAEIAFAAVDEALLQLSPNDSWKLLDAMMAERPLAVITATAQTQVVGKRHYGRKALVTGGGGGGDLSALNRQDFRPVLLWRGRVPLDAAGRARLAVPLSDALSSFKLVAIATDGAQRFGTGDASIRTVQDLTIYAGVPPLVRTGDSYAATFTLRNGSARPMTVTATADTLPRIGRAPPLTVTIPAGSATPVTWHVTAPDGPDHVAWTVNARAADGRAADRATVSQAIVPAVPVETWASTLLRVGVGGPVPIAPPAGALPGRGGVSLLLTDSLAPPLDGVRRYMRDYPYGCFEQRLSKAVALGDGGAFAGLMGDLPTYLDGDGLLRFWPDEGQQGSIALTAYTLSLTAEAGLAIPETSRAKLIAGLTSVAEGRLTREGDGQGEARINRLLAFAALARNGAANAGMAAGVNIRVSDLPTALLTDWIVALGRTGQDARPAEAELRKRLVYEGTRLDLVDSANQPWWLMSSADEAAARAVLLAAGRPGWQDETPRMMAGLALRQMRGHWDTTTANAWGVLAARRFASVYPPAAVAGTTSVRFGAVARELAWPVKGSVTLPLAASPLMLAQSGGAGPWAQVTVSAAVPLRQGVSAGYRMTRDVSVIRRAHPDRLTRGDVLKVRITVDASAERNWVVVSDPVPAGATIVGDLGGQSAALAADAAGGGEGVSPAYVERTQEAWRGYFAWVPRGRFIVEYAVRLNGAGRFSLPPSRVEAMYSPAIFAALPNRPVTVAMR